MERGYENTEQGGFLRNLFAALSPIAAPLQNSLSNIFNADASTIAKTVSCVMSSFYLLVGIVTAARFAQFEASGGGQAIPQELATRTALEGIQKPSQP